MAVCASLGSASRDGAPSVTRVAVLRDAASSSGIGYMGALRLAASSFGMELTPVGITDAGEIERGLHPGGNLTGFTSFEFSIGTKWLEALKQTAPRVTRVALMFNPQSAPYADLFLQPVKAAAS